MRLVLLASLGVLGCTSQLGPDRMPPPVDAAALVRPASPPSNGAAAARRHSVEIDGHALVVWCKSAAEPRDAIVLVHGRTWSTLPDFDLQVPGERRSLMDVLVEHGFAVYGVDLRGYGATARDDSGWLTPSRAVEDVAGVLAWVGARHPELEPPTLLGWSMGALVVQLTAQRHPDRLSTLVLYGHPRDPDAVHPAGPGPEARPPRRKTTARAAAEDFTRPEVVSRATIEAFVDAALRTDPVKVDWRATDELAELDPAAVRVPTLLIHGEHDPYTPIDAQAKLFSRLGNPDRAWVIVPGGDHAAHLEDTAPRFVDAVVTFVRRARLR